MLMAASRLAVLQTGMPSDHKLIMAQSFTCSGHSANYFMSGEGETLSKGSSGNKTSWFKSSFWRSYVRLHRAINSLSKPRSISFCLNNPCTLY